MENQKAEVKTNQTSRISEERLFTLLKLDKSRRRWRFIAIIFAILYFGAYATLKDKFTDQPVKQTPYIAEINIDGMITGDNYRLKKLEEIALDDNIKAVILNIDSPGGEMVAGLELLDELKALNKRKPLVVQMKSIAASAGYLISLAGDHVVANKATLTGSIGVLMPLIDATELADKVGIKSTEVVSGDLKTITSPLSKRTEKGEEFLQETVNQLKEIFMTEVRNRREISPSVELLISDGRFIIGQKAFEFKLIDEIGNRKSLLKYLQEERNIDSSLDIVEVSLEEDEETSLKQLFLDQVTSYANQQITAIINGLAMERKVY